MTRLNPTRILLVLLLVAAPFFEGGATPTGLIVTQSLVFALLLTLLAGKLRAGRISIGTGMEGAAALLFFAVAVISFLGVDYTFGSFLALWNIAVYLLLALALLLMRGGQFSEVPAVVAGSSVLQAGLILLLEVPQNMTSSGSFANASQAAAYLNIGIFVAAAKMIPSLHKKERMAFVWGGVILVDLAALLVLGARGALLALVLVASVWLLAGPSPVLRTRKSRLAVGAGIAVLTIFSASALVSRFDRIGDSYRYDRIRIWKVGLEAAADHPVVGMGPGMFERRGYRYNFPLDREMFRYSKTPGSTHSTYLEALAELGAAGLACVVLLLLTLMPRLWKSRGEAGVAALLVTLVHGLVDTPFAVPAITMSLLALVVPLVRPADAAAASMFVTLDTRRREGRSFVAAAAGLLVFVYAAAVLIPYSSHISYVGGVRASRPGEPAAAIDHAVRLDPLNPLYVATRGELTWDRNKPLTLATLAVAHRDLAKAHRLDPGNHGYLVMLAQLHSRACFEIGATDASLARAVRYYRMAIALGRKDPRPFLELGAFLMAFGKGEEGVRLIGEAIQIEPLFLGAHLALARALLETGRRDEAADAFRRLEEVKERLTGYHPKNGYEAGLMRLDESSVSRLAERLL